MTTNPPDLKVTTLDDLGELARHLAEARNLLATSVAELNAAIEALKADAMPTLRFRIDAAAAAWKALEERIQAHPELFVKPRTVSLHGIKFGIEKGKGVVEVANPKATLKAIRAKLPELAEVLIKQKEEPVKKALLNLTAQQLKAIGVQLTGAGDQVVIRPENGAVDKLVKALIKATVDEGDDTD